MTARYSFPDIVGKSEAINNVIRKAKNYGKADLTVLITGESGTGKEVLANSIHNISPRKNGPFVAVNCATLPLSLLESELFGYEDGAFTGARKGGKAGLFELAQYGTILLDEITEITLPAQAQLLRVLQEKALRRVGGNKIIPIDVRVIAATNADLYQLVKMGQFRGDLYYRLNVLNLKIPALRERKEDIPLMIEHLINKQNMTGRKIKIPDLFMAKLQDYRWPGNVRELENFVEKFVLLSQDNEDTFHLLEELYTDFFHYERDPAEMGENSIVVEVGTLKEMELQIIENMYQRTGLDKSALARALGISRSNLWSKLKDIDNNQGYF